MYNNNYYYYNDYNSKFNNNKIYNNEITSRYYIIEFTFLKSAFFGTDPEIIFDCKSHQTLFFVKIWLKLVQ